MFSRYFPLLLGEVRFPLYTDSFHPFRECGGHFGQFCTGLSAAAGLANPDVYWLCPPKGLSSHNVKGPSVAQMQAE